LNDELLNRVGQAIRDGYSEDKKSLLVELYHQAFPLKDKLKLSCGSCGRTAFSKLYYFYHKQKT